MLRRAAWCRIFSSISVLRRTVISEECYHIPVIRKCDISRRPLSSQEVSSKQHINESKTPEEKELPVPDWESMILGPLKKNLYLPHQNVTERSEEEVKQYREKHDLSVSSPVGLDIPKPIQHLTEASLPSYMNDTLIRKGLETLTIIPAQGWPILMSGFNMIGVGANSHDRIFAYMLPAIMHIKHQPPLQRGDGPIVLVLAPTKTLAQQIKSVADTYGTSSHIQSACIFDEAAKTSQARDFMTGKHIVIGTPKRVLRFLQRKTINLRRTTYLVVDEADRLLDMGLEPQMRMIIEQIRPDRQVSVWSTSWPKEVETWVENLLRKEYIKLNVGSSEHSEYLSEWKPML